MSKDDRWQEVESILDRALDAPEAERNRVVRECCSGDPELEMRVSELLAAAAGSSALDQPAVQFASTLAEFTAAPRGLQGAPGERLGAYRLLSLLGEGGMGRVHLAERADGQFKRTVALKILASPVAGDTARVRFQRERQILADLRHDHIAQLLDAGVADDGRPWFALEYVDGLSLTEYCKRLRLGREERLTLVLQACDAVAHAHRQGIVHRDLKPSNLMVSKDPAGAAHLFVLDFGIARAAGTADLTMVGDILGTPGYMAPEQASGDGETIDRRVDIFALGVVIYELLCGRRPFEGATPGEILGAVVSADPPGPRTLVPDLPRDLETILLTCLEKSPQRRYGSAQALAGDIRSYLDGEPIAARAPGLGHRIRRTVRRHPVAAALIAAVCLSALVGLEVGMRGRRMAREQAELSRRFGATAEQVAAEMRHEYLTPIHDVSGARQRVEHRLAALELELADVPPVLRPIAWVALGRGRLALGNNDRAAADLDAAWSAGVRTPDAAVALAEVEVFRYARERALAEAMADPSLREARIAEVTARSRHRVLELSDIARSGGDSATSDLVAARIAYLEGDLDRAAALATAAARDAPWLYEALLLAGEIELARGSELRRSGATEGIAAHLETALGHFRAASTIGESDPAAHLRLCAAAAFGLDLSLHVIATDPDRLAAIGLTACRAAAQAAPGDAAIPEQESALQTTYARELSRRDRDPFPAVTAATEAAKRALALDGASTTALRRLGDAWAFRAEFERERGRDAAEAISAAVAALEQAAARATEDPGIWNSLGLARWEELLRAQEHDAEYAPAAIAAADAFARAVAIEPRYAYAWGNLGSMQNKLGEIAIAAHRDPVPAFDRAREAFERALEIYPEYSTAVNNLGNVFHNLAAAHETRGEDPRGDFEHALAQFDRAAELKPDWAVPHFNQARTALARAQSQVRRNASPEFDLARALQSLEAAFALRSTVLQGHMLAGEVHLFRAEHARQTGRSPDSAVRDARASLARIHALDPDAGAELEQGISAFRRHQPTGFYPDISR